MAKLKAKRAAHKITHPKTAPKKAGRPSNLKAAPVAAKADRKSNGAANGAPHKNGSANGAAATENSVDPKILDAGTIKTKSGVDLTEKVRELLILAKEQGHLTYDDINDALPDSVVTPEDLDQIYTKLANLETDIVDQAEVDRVKQPEAEEEEEKG